MSLTIKDLRVLKPHHEDGEQWKIPTVADLVEIIQQQGGEVVESRRTSNDIGSHVYLSGSPGRYLILPLPADYPEERNDASID